jgi:hypothetical protein
MWCANSCDVWDGNRPHRLRASCPDPAGDLALTVPLGFELMDLFAAAKGPGASAHAGSRDPVRARPVHSPRSDVAGVAPSALCKGRPGPPQFGPPNLAPPDSPSLGPEPCDPSPRACQPKKRTVLAAHPAVPQNSENTLQYRGKIRPFLSTTCQDIWIRTRTHPLAPQARTLRPRKIVCQSRRHTLDAGQSRSSV